MNILSRIEKRLKLPGDSETRSSQKTISVTLMFAGGLITVMNVITYLSLGMKAAALVYMGWTLFVVSAAILILIFPRLWFPVLSVVILAILPMTLTTHLYSGGFQSGLMTAVWLLQVPIGASLFLGVPFTIVALFAYVLSVALASFLEPFAQSIAPELDLGSRMMLAASNMIMMGILATAAGLYLLRRAEYFRRRADSLLLNILPESIASRLKESSETIADGYDGVTVLFADIVGSTPLFSRLEPAEAVDWLNDVFTMLDDLVEKHRLEKIRTIGDSYMVASGVPEPRSDHASAMAQFALEMVSGLDQMPARHGVRLNFRLGINSGPLVAGVIGRLKFQYDLWGDTVNIASRMESQGVAGKVQISHATYELIKVEFECESRGSHPIKGKGEMETWFLKGTRIPGVVTSKAR